MLGLLVLGHPVQLVCQNGQCTCRKRHVTIAKRAASMTVNETMLVRPDPLFDWVQSQRNSSIQRSRCKSR